ncbi:exodeoxyribonuclease VIII [Microvirga lupini]|uniref:Exodeoxyribonuclease VIII n=1 Tax=Microvirga lupini TaxID=420324 RepID=A0A7W4YVW1_9HYPH|nr:exodeoxyribonuclease VIII [Microvirga lupini]
MSEQQLHGLVELTNEQYHSGPGISKSHLDDIAVSPLNYWDKRINPAREPEVFKHCFAVGDGTHKLVLEPGTFEETYAVGFDKSAYPQALATVDDMKQELSKKMAMTSGTKPELARRLVDEEGYPRDKILMYLEQDYNATLGNKIIIPAKDYKDMLCMLQAVNRHPFAGGLLSGAEVEQSFFIENDQDYIDHDTGKVVTVRVLRKCRTDAITHDGQWVVDLKTTDDVSEAGFGTTIARRRYEVQAAWYLDILKALYGRDAPRGFAFIAAQKTRPYDVAVHYMQADHPALERGRRLYQRDLLRIVRCREENYWPGADGGDLLQAKLPYWADREFDHA